MKLLVFLFNFLYLGKVKNTRISLFLHFSGTVHFVLYKVMSLIFKIRPKLALGIVCDIHTKPGEQAEILPAKCQHLLWSDHCMTQSTAQSLLILHQKKYGQKSRENRIPIYTDGRVMAV